MKIDREINFSDLCRKSEKNHDATKKFITWSNPQVSSIHPHLISSIRFNKKKNSVTNKIYKFDLRKVNLNIFEGA